MRLGDSPSPASHVEERWHTFRSRESWPRALASTRRVPRETERAGSPLGQGRGSWRVGSTLGQCCVIADRGGAYDRPLGEDGLRQLCVWRDLVRRGAQVYSFHESQRIPPGHMP